MKKKYIIKIVGCTIKLNMWYKKRLGEEFEAELKIKSTTVIFAVDNLHYIYPNDCVVVSEFLEPQYQKN